MTPRFGICGNARFSLPSETELLELGCRGLRIFGYSLEQLSRALAVAQAERVVVTINNEWAEVKGDWSGLEKLCDSLARHPFNGQIWAVEVGNELDSWHYGEVSPEFPPDSSLTPARAASFVKRAAPILRAGGLKVILSSVASSHWQEYLEELADLAGGAADYACLHPYQSALGDVPGHNWEQLHDKVIRASRLARLPVVLTEAGIKVGDAGGPARHALWCKRLVEYAHSVPESICPFVCLFAWADAVGRADERGISGFGLRDEHDNKRPAWEAVRQALGGPILTPLPPMVPPAVPPTTPERTLFMDLPAEVLRDLWYAIRDESELAYEPSFAIPKSWSRDPLRYGSPLGPERDGYQAFTKAVAHWLGGDAVEWFEAA